MSIKFKQKYFSNKSLYLGGVDELVTAGNVTSFSATDKFSLSAWVKFTTLTSVNIISKQFSASPFRGWNIQTSGGSFRFQLIDNLSNRKTIDTDLTFNDGLWHHVVATKSNGATTSDLKIYVDGIEQATTVAVDTGTVTTITNTEDLAIGARGSAGTYAAFFIGNIDEVLIVADELTLFQVQNIFNNGQPKNESSIPNGVSYYRMGDGPGDNWNVTTSNEWTFIDQIGSNDMTTVNCEEADVENESPKVLNNSIKFKEKYFTNKSLYLDGVDEYVNIDSILSPLSTTTAGTWSTWVKPVDATPSTSQILMAFGDTNAQERLFLPLRSDGKLAIASVDSGTTQFNLITDSVVVSDNTWHHIVVVQDGTSPVLYVDAVEYSTSEGNATYLVSTDITSWFNDLAGIDNGRIGSLLDSGLSERNHFNGNISDTLIFNRALTSREISQIYNNGKPKDESKREGLVGYYRMGAGIRDNYNSDIANEWVFRDQSPHSYHITSINAEEADVENDYPKSSYNTISLKNS